MCILESERLNLRPPRPWDVQDIAVWLGDPAVSRMLARIPHPYTEEHAEDFLALPPDGRHVFVIEAKPDGRFLGMIGLHPDGEGYELGYWLGKPYWGLGYASEAAARMLAYGFETLGLETVRAGWFLDNPASGHLLAELGGRHNGSRLRFCAARNADVLCHDMLLTRANFLRKQAAWERQPREVEDFASGCATRKKAS
jgi:RimJ/RimL family protein N-acetyltransferase